MMRYTCLDIFSAVDSCEFEKVGHQNEVMHLIFRFDAFSHARNILLDCFHQFAEGMLHKIDGEDTQFIFKGAFTIRILLQIHTFNEHRV